MSVRRLLLAVACVARGLRASSAFCTPIGLLSTSRSISRADTVRTPFSGCLISTNGETRMMGVARSRRTRLFESIRSNRDKIGRAVTRLRDAIRSGDDELAERLKAFIMHLRGKDPQFATQDAMDEALEQGLFSTAAKLKLKLADINQNPFRQSLLDSGVAADGSGGSGGGDISEDMSWGFDQTFFGEEGDGDGDDEPDDYDDI